MTPTQPHDPIEELTKEIAQLGIKPESEIWGRLHGLLFQAKELGRIAGVREAIDAQPRRRILLHSVVAKGSQEDLNDTWRKGYNEALDDYQSSLTNLLSLHE